MSDDFVSFRNNKGKISTLEFTIVEANKKSRFHIDRLEVALNKHPEVQYEAHINDFYTILYFTSGGVAL